MELNLDEMEIKQDMSNEELIKKFYIAFQKHDKETCIKLCDENIEWQTSDGMPNGGKYVGRDQVFENYFPNMLKNFKEFHAIPEKVLSLKDHIMVSGIYRRITKNDNKFEVLFSHVYLVEGNKIVQFRQFTDTEIIKNALN